MKASSSEMHVLYPWLLRDSESRRNPGGKLPNWGVCKLLARPGLGSSLKNGLQDWVVPSAKSEILFSNSVHLSMQDSGSGSSRHLEGFNDSTWEALGYACVQEINFCLAATVFWTTHLALLSPWQMAGRFLHRDVHLSLWLRGKLYRRHCSTQGTRAWQWKLNLGR